MESSVFGKPNYHRTADRSFGSGGPTVRKIVLGVLFVAIGHSVFGDGGRGRHKRVFVLPTSGKVKIDGRLDDWNLSGQILIYVSRETMHFRSAKFAMMYDERALYLGAEVRDLSPMMNRHDPYVDATKAWDADACQFRMVLDPAQGFPVDLSAFRKDENDQMVHTILWYYTDRKEANLQMLFGMNYQLPKAGYPMGVVPHEKFSAFYRKMEDGKGYVFEYRIPWRTLEARNPPKGGDIVSATVQFNWSRPDGLKTAGGSAWAYDVMSKPGFPFQTSSCWGKAIFSPKTTIPKQFVEPPEETPERRLPLAFDYELPEDGEVSIALFDTDGAVVRKILSQAPRRAGLHTEYWDGLDDTGKPLKARTYTWKGLYHKPLKTQFLFSVHNSGDPPYKTEDNTGGWGADHGIPKDVCATGNYIILAWDVAESGWGIIRTDLNGKKHWGSKATAVYLASDGKRIFASGGRGFHKGEGIEIFSLEDSRPLNFGRGTLKAEVPKGGDAEMNKVTGLAYGNGTLYASYKSRDLVVLYDPNEGNIRQSWSVPSPARLAVCPDGSVVVVSESHILKVKEGRVKRFISEHIDSPTGIAVDSSGRIYVANRRRLQNVSVFSPDGKYLRSIGKKGGRPPVGRYKKNGMLQPEGIAVDREGKLWVAEAIDCPKRISVWNTRNGKLIKEFFGGSAYATWVWIDPRRPNEVYCHNVIWRVNWKKLSWKPYSTLWRSTAPNMIHAPGVGGYAGHLRVITARNGRQFAWGMWRYSNVLLMREGDLFKPIASGINVAKGNPFVGWPPYEIFSDNERYPNGAYLWQDTNDDQTIQEEEIMRPDYVRRAEKVINWVDEDLNLWFDSGHILRPVEFEGDRPIYDFSKAEPIPFQGRHSNYTSLWLDPYDGTVYTIAPGRGEGIGFARWKPDGSLIWGHCGLLNWSIAINKPILKPGELWGPTMPLGVAGNFTGFATYFGPFHIFTRDGLYVAMLFRDGRLGGVGPDTIACEAFSGQLVKIDKLHKYLFLTGDQDGRVTEILGLDTVKYLKGGSYEVTPEMVEEAKGALKEYEAQQARIQPLVINRGKGSLPTADQVRRTVDENRAFSASVAYDSKNLYLLYDVESPNELTNSIADPRLIFTGGNAIDVQIATNLTADPERREPAPGDIRILVTRQKGKPFAVIFRTRVRGFKGERVVLQSPTGKVAFDSIETTDKIGLLYRKKKRGFEATVTIPLDLIGLKLEPLSVVRLDLGYIFGNSAGNRSAVRSYWSNTSFTASVVNDIPHESRLEPEHWGTALVE